MKLSPENKLILVEKAQAGENQRAIADEFKISQGRVSQIVTAYEKHLAVEAKQRQGTRTDIKEKIPESDTGQARDKAAHHPLLSNGAHAHHLPPACAGAPWLQ